MTGTLDGKVAIVTGGTAGIGLAIASALTQLGASVLITYRNDDERAARAVASLGDRAIAKRSESADPDAARRLVADAIEHFGAIDIVVANAGQTGRSPLGATEAGTYDRIFDANVRGVWALLEAAGSEVRAGGTIVLLSSVRTVMNTPETALYTASKAAV